MGKAEFDRERDAAMKDAKKRLPPLKLCRACYTVNHAAAGKCTGCNSAFPQSVKVRWK